MRYMQIVGDQHGYAYCFLRGKLTESQMKVKTGQNATYSRPGTSIFNSFYLEIIK